MINCDQSPEGRTTLFDVRGSLKLPLRGLCLPKPYISSDPIQIQYARLDSVCLTRSSLASSDSEVRIFASMGPQSTTVPFQGKV